jgi:hypothetical protein
MRTCDPRRATTRSTCPATTSCRGSLTRHTLSLNHLQKTPTDYILKLWLINGITSVRDLGQTFHQPGWLLDIKRRSERNEIAAPRIDVYPFFANLPHPFSTVGGQIAVFHEPLRLDQ